jgi:hypothetical protein
MWGGRRNCKNNKTAQNAPPVPRRKREREENV